MEETRNIELRKEAMEILEKTLLPHFSFLKIMMEKIDSGVEEIIHGKIHHEGQCCVPRGWENIGSH